MLSLAAGLPSFWMNYKGVSEPAMELIEQRGGRTG